MRRVRQLASEASGPSVVMTFEPHPVRVLRPDQPFGRIFSLDDQRQQAEEIGIDYLVVEPFSREFSRLKPERFLLEWLYKPFSPSSVVVGYDFAFGEGKRGTIEFLQERAQKLWFSVEVLPPVKAEGHLVSSTRIRQALREGDARLATALLGRRFYLEGLVVKGVGRGRQLGWPTANLGGMAAETYPMFGVYCAWAWIEGKRYMAMANVGQNPTFLAPAAAMPSLARPASPLVEAHILGLSGEIYGQKLRLEFVDRLRDERRFPSAEALARQIGVDVERGRKILEADVQGLKGAEGHWP
jgi:riboflavin kinase/FMN adenylyltransferase